MSNYYEKYLKYKEKYLTLKKTQEGGDNENDVRCFYKNIININNDNFVDILKNLNCKDIRNLITSKNSICKFRSLTKEQWYQLIDKIVIPNYPLYSKTNPENPEILYKSLMTQTEICNQNIYCRLFFTKCLHKHLIEKYNNNDLTQCWYQSILQNNTEDYKYFNILIDTTIIGGRAFRAKKITSVIIPDSVTTIGDSAFFDNKLKKVTIPNSVTTIGDLAFFDNELTSVTIGNKVTTIGKNAFGYNNLNSVTIGNSVTTIGDSAFRNNQLESVTIPNSVTTIGGWAFLRNYIKKITIGNSVEKIGDFAFYNNYLTSVTIPASVKYFGYGAFSNNELIIEKVTFPNSFTKKNKEDFEDLCMHYLMYYS